MRPQVPLLRLLRSNDRRVPDVPRDDCGHLQGVPLTARTRSRRIIHLTPPPCNSKVTSEFRASGAWALPLVARASIPDSKRNDGGDGDLGRRTESGRLEQQRERTELRPGLHPQQVSAPRAVCELPGEAELAGAAHRAGLHCEATWVCAGRRGGGFVRDVWAAVAQGQGPFGRAKGTPEVSPLGNRSRRVGGRSMPPPR